MSAEWTPIEMELVHHDHLLRVHRTRSPQRFAWFVVPLDEATKHAYWMTELGKGASKAIAKGYSSSFDKAQKDAIAMAEAIVKSGGNR